MSFPKTLQLIGLASLLVISTSCENAVSVKRMSNSEQRIVGGSVFSDLPAVGALTLYGQMHCTGTLVEPRKVVTAGHCVSGYQASSMRFILGQNVDNPDYELKVAKIQAHPSYNSYSITNDIGVVTLAEDAPLAPLPVLQTSMDSSWVGTSLLFVGYGVANGYSQTGAGIKRAVWMDLSQVGNTSFAYSASGRNTCSGDSGGPAFFRTPSGEYQLAGVTSYGDQYCTSYGVDTRVDQYLDFLDINTSTEPSTETPTAPDDEPTNVSPYDPADDDPCQGESYEGRCEGDTVIWCENSAVYTDNCGERNKVCSYDPTQHYFACGDAASSDPCQGETYEGRCEGDTVIWCENSAVQQQNCATQYGRSCGWSNAKGYNGCL